jgi:hypothetical protein
MSDFQRQLFLIALGVLATTGFLTWSVTTIRYHITGTHLKVTWLGLPVRWIPLGNIKHVGTRPEFWSERWPNVLFDTGRTLVIHRYDGWFKSFLITPKYPFQFKASLEQARESVVRGPFRKLGRKAPAPAPSPSPSPSPTPAPTPSQSGVGSGDNQAPSASSGQVPKRDVA